MSFQVISSYDRFVSFGNQSYQTMDIGWIPLETPKIGENHGETNVDLKKNFFGRIFGSGTFSILSIILFQLRWLVGSESLPRSGALELKHKPSVLPWDFE